MIPKNALFATCTVRYESINALHVFCTTYVQPPTLHLLSTIELPHPPYLTQHPLAPFPIFTMPLHSTSPSYLPIINQSPPHPHPHPHPQPTQKNPKNIDETVKTFRRTLHRIHKPLHSLILCYFAIRICTPTLSFFSFPRLHIYTEHQKKKKLSS